MSKASRDKGLLGEREVRHVFERSFPVRGLEGLGDHLVIVPGGPTLHIEVKRAEALRMSDWSKQAESEAPESTMPILVYRRSREPWRASLLLDHLIMLLQHDEQFLGEIAAHHDLLR